MQIIYGLLLVGLASAADFSKDNIIDTHAHIGQFKGFDLSEAALLKALKESHVKLALVSNIDGAELPGTTKNLDEVTANEATLAAVKRNPDLLRGILWARPEDGKAAKLERFFTKEKLFVGIKIHPDMNHFSADDARVSPYLALCQKHGVPAVFHSGAPGSNSSPEKIYAAAKKFPKVPVVLYHMGFGGEHALAIKVVQESLKKKDADLYLETAQAEASGVMEAVKVLGADRVLFGTDAVYYGEEHYNGYEPLVKKLKAELPEKDFAKIVRENAKRLFGL